MADERESGVPSTAAVAGHPIHPMLVAFPIAFFLGALGSDVANWLTHDPFWARASFWLLAAALVAGLAAAVAGITDFLTIERVRALTVAWLHFAGNLTVMVVGAVNLALRAGTPDRVSGPELTLSVLTAVLLGVTGWLGGEMVYRHGIGMDVAGAEVTRLRFGRRRIEG